METSFFRRYNGVREALSPYGEFLLIGKDTGREDIGIPGADCAGQGRRYPDNDIVGGTCCLGFSSSTDPKMCARRSLWTYSWDLGYCHGLDRKWRR